MEYLLAAVFDLLLINLANLVTVSSWLVALVRDSTCVGATDGAGPFP